MKWAFIDYENIGSFKNLNLSIYEKIIIFVGAKQKTPDLSDICHNKLIEFACLKIAEVSSNNLDFHLFYYLGRYDDSASADVSFDIISNDRAFRPVVDHIKLNGRSCRLILTSNSTKAPNNVHKLPSQYSNTKAPQQFIKYLVNTSEKQRPKNIQALNNFIISYLNIIDDKESVIKKVIKCLIEEEVIDIDSDKKLLNYKR